MNIAKHPKGTRITDSARGGMDKTMAKEIRCKELLLKEIARVQELTDNPHPSVPGAALYIKRTGYCEGLRQALKFLDDSPVPAEIVPAPVAYKGVPFYYVMEEADGRIVGVAPERRRAMVTGWLRAVAGRKWTVLDAIALFCSLGIWIAFFSMKLGEWIWQ